MRRENIGNKRYVKVLMVVLGIIVILLVITIMFFSSKSPSDSSMQSSYAYRVLKKIDQVLDFSNLPIFQKVERQLKMWWFKTEYVPAEMLIRKTAHFSLYFLLAFFVTGFVQFWKKDVIVSIFVGIGLPNLIAVFDEYNQLYYNRGSSLNDVMIDLSGAVCGTLSFLLIFLMTFLIRKFIVSRFKERHSTDV
ncbi:MAG TPA: VanZ family protein [Fervidobacterium sp.]|nr:VanZ family protein [Fervidobacterium sp.]HQI10277.1 VanZ family protein [Fervidobacterium sp.]HRV38562.1 VanZ family protein [Fervidobacterium sp.]